MRLSVQKNSSWVKFHRVNFNVATTFRVLSTKQNVPYSLFQNKRCISMFRATAKGHSWLVTARYRSFPISIFSDNVKLIPLSSVIHEILLSYLYREAPKYSYTLTVNSSVEASTTVYNVSVRIPLNQAVILPAGGIPQSIIGVYLDLVRPLKYWHTRADRPGHHAPFTRKPWNHPVTMRPVLMFDLRFRLT